MSFLNPILLAGLAAVSLPILIHLLNRRRYQRVAWAAMRFLQVAIERNQRRMNIEDLILLLLRCLILALLAVALARPALLSDAAGAFGPAKVTGVILLDNSLSMGMTDGQSTRFQKAQEAAEAILDSMPGGSAAAVFLISDTVRGVIPEPTFDLNLARKVVREAPLTDRATEVLPALQKGLDVLETKLALRKEIFLITDGQANGWRQLTEIQRALERAKARVRVHLILVNENEERNVGVSDLRLAGGLSPVGQPLRFDVGIFNHSRNEARQIAVRLQVDNEPACDEFTIESIPADGSRNISLFAKLRTEGFHSIQASVDPDSLSADDRRTIALRAIGQVKVLLVDGQPASEPRDSETFFLQHALVPVRADAVRDYFVQTTTISSPELSRARLDDYDAVILANVADLSAATLASLEIYVNRGGGLIIFPGDLLNATFYNDQLYRARQLMPAEFGAPQGDASQDQNFTRLQSKDYDHSIATLWNDPGAGRLDGARFFRWLELKPGPTNQMPRPTPSPPSDTARSPMGEAGDAPPEDLIGRVVLRYAGGTPAVMERSRGLGSVLQFSSSADTAWNDLPVRPAWVPLLHRTLGHIIQRHETDLNLRVGDRFARRTATEYLDRDVTFTPPAGAGKLSELRRVELVGGWPMLHFEQTDRAGLYEAKIADPPLALKFAAQPEPGESALETLSSLQWERLGEAANVVRWQSGESTTWVEHGQTGTEFWLPLLLICLALTLVETFLGQWFSRSK